MAQLQELLTRCLHPDPDSDAECRLLPPHIGRHAGPDSKGRWRQWGVVDARLIRST